MVPIRQWATLLGLASKYGKLTSTDLSVDVVNDIATALGFGGHLDDTIVAAFSKLMVDEEFDTIAEVLSRPEVFPKVTALLMPKRQAPVVDIIRYCPKCDASVYHVLSSQELETGVAVLNCTSCRTEFEVKES